MLKVISNTTPIISLLKISKIEILKDLYSEIIITIGVLIKAKKYGFIKHVKPLLIELTKKDVWISERLIAEVCKLTDE